MELLTDERWADLIATRGDQPALALEMMRGRTRRRAAATRQMEE